MRIPFFTYVLILRKQYPLAAGLGSVPQQDQPTMKCYRWISELHRRILLCRNCTIRKGNFITFRKLASWACVLHFQKSGQPEFWKVNSASNASVIQTLIFTIFQLQENEKMNLLGTTPNPKDCQLRCQAMNENIKNWMKKDRVLFTVFSRNWILTKVRWTLVKEFFLSDNDSRDSLREIMHMNSYIIAMIQEFTNR